MEINTKSPNAFDRDIKSILKRIFGFDNFLEGQETVITRLLDGKSVLAIFPTGGGKSVCYQLPALALDGLTLVISPLIALMKDQIDFLVSRDIQAARLDSSLDHEETLKVYDDLNNGRTKLLYISPERLSNERFLHLLKRRRISLLAVDEAHCISQWGHNFRPDYMKIARLAKQLKIGRLLALTATATPKVARDIAESFSIAVDDVVRTGFYRSNLNLHITPCEAVGRDALLLSRLRERTAGPAIVYVTLQRTAENVAAFLSRNGFDAHAYHAGMKTEERNKIQDMFMNSDDAIIVATIAFGMGVDKANIRYVYHYNLPKGLESYMQEIGRSGRDGKEAICEMLACSDDVVTLENFSYGDTPDEESLDALVNYVLSNDASFDVSVYELSGDYDIRPLVVKTLLTYLELENVIQSTGYFYSSYKFKTEKASQEILARFDTERADFLRSIFRHAIKGKIWFSLDVEEISRLIKKPRERIVAALSYLEEKGDIELSAAGLRQGYRVLNIPDDIKALCEKLNKRFQQREEQDIERIRKTLDLVEFDGCKTQYMLAYFGEKHGDCGHCSWCAGVKTQPLPSAHYSIPDEKKIANLLLQIGNEKSLAGPRRLTRFLCGISSPAATRAKLREHPMFGIFEGVPFHKILEKIRETLNG